MRRLVQGLSRSAGKAAAVGLGLALGCSTLAGLVGGPAGAEPAAGTVATVAVGSYPSAVVVAPTGNRAFVANSRQPTTYSTTSASNGSVSVINTTTNPPSVTATVTVKRDPEALAVRPGGTQLYVVNAGSNSVSILKLTTATPTVTATVTVGATKPEAITFTPTGNYAYVTSGSGNDLDVINCATKAVVHKTLGHIPHGLAFAPGGSPLYVTAPNGGRSPQVLVVNPANPAAPVVTSTLSVGGTPHAIGFVPGTTHTAYMTNIDPQTVTVLDASATPPTVSGSVHFDAQPWTVAFTPGGQRAYVNLPGDNQLVVLDTSTDPPTVLGRDGGLTHPSGMAVTPDGQWVYAANRSSSGTVSVFPEVTPPVVTSVTTQDGPTAGGNTVTITGQRLTGATAVTFGSAPGTGIAVNATGTTLTVTAPAGSGTVPVTVKIGAAQSTPVDYTYAPSITTTTLPAAEVGVAYTTTLSAAGGTGGYTWSVTPGSLPTGLSLDPASGTISGTPTAAGTSTATVTVADSSTPPQTASATLAVDVQPPVAVTTTSLPPAAVGQGYRATLAADGGQGPFDWSVAAGTLPTGLALDASTGVISGVPAQGAGGEQTVTVKVTDALGGTATAPLVVDTFGITPGTPPSGEVGAPYLTTFTATEGTAPYWWAVTSGSLPAGLTLDPATGVLSGTPTTAGVATFTVSATDSATPAVTVSEPVSLVIDAAGPPTASSVAPAFGPAAGGTKVTIHGTALGHVTAVTFGSVPARSFTVVSDTTVTAVAPGGSGTVNVTVTNPDGTSPAGTATQFTYTTWSGRTVSNPAGPSVQLYGISCPATGDCVAVGATTVSATTGSSTPTAFVQHDGTWLAATLPSTGRGSLNGVSCTAVTRCMAVGQVLGSDSLYHQLVELLRTGAWTAITLPDVGGDTSWYSLNGVACPSPTRCVAVGGYVTRYGWFQPLTEILTTSGGNWSAVPTTPALPSNVTRGITATLYGVSCPSTTTCVAVGQVDNFTWTTYGTVPSPLIEDLGGTTTDPTWTPVDTPQSDNGVGLNSVSCPAVGDCVAVGSDYGTMGALRLADGAWSTTPVPHTGRATGGDLFGVTCPNTDECLASGQATGGGVTGGAVETFAGGYWQGVLVATQGRAIDCTSATDCVTAGFGGATRNSSYGRVAESLPAVPVPVVTGLSPATGSIDGGTTVTISGGGFTGATGVLFGAVPATGFSVTWDGRIVATAPAGSTGAVDVTVTGPGGTSATSPADTFTYGRPATVTGLDTTTGPTTGGTSVVVHGTNFSQALAVDFGSNPATFTVDSDTELTATAPPGPAGTVDVTVSTPPGPSATSPADRFTYVAVPTSFSITVNGSGTSGTSTYGTAATFAEVGLPASATGTVTFTSGTKTLCVATMPASTSCHPPATLGAGTYPGITASFVNTDGSYGNSTSTNTVSLTVTTARLGASYAYVGGPGIGNGDLATISTTTHHAGPTFTLGAAPTMLAITPDGQTLYANAGTTTAPGTPSHEIVPIATATGAVGPAMTFPYFPNDIAITPDGQTGWVANGYDPAGDDLTSFSVATGAIGRTIQLGTTAECWAVAITPQGTTAYVARDPAAGGHGNVVPVDLATGTVGTPITVDGSPTAIAITPDGKKAYVTNSTGPVTQITLTATWTKDTTKPISVGTTTTTGLAITPDGATVYVTSWHNKLIPITVATGTAGSSISVSGSPWKVAITPAGTTAYVGPLNSTRVTLVTLRTKSTTRVTVTPYGYAVAVTPDQAPVAALSVIPDVVGRATSFDASASTVDFGTITSYAWTFGDGQTATTTTPTTTHTYMAAETYTASVTETDSAGTSTTVVHTGHSVLRNGGPQARTTRTVTVTPAPTSFSIDVDGSGHATVHLGTVATLSESGLPSQATGTVAFTSGTTVLCTATLPATSCTTTPTLPVASYPAITAHFGGDHNYESSTATGTVALTVIPPLPVVTGVTPPAGYITGGTSVTIMGRHLSGATGVDFGTSPAQSFSDDSGTEITAVSPAGSPGPVDITVTTGGGTSAVSADDHFTYLAIPTTTTLGSDQNPSTAGQEVTFTATVATDPAGLAVPTGTVSFVDTATGTTLCSTVALSTATRQQEASCAHTFTTTSAGDEIVASYVNSDGNFVGSASDPVDQAVTHATAAKVVVTTQPPTTVTAGTPFGLTATVEDAYGNVVTTSSATVTVAITSGPDGATLLGTTTVTATAGVATFGGLTLDKAATGYTLKVTSGSLTPTVTTTVTVTPAAATHFVLQAPGTATAGTAVTVTITATDAYGNTATGYVGTVHFTSTDPQAVLPGDVTFTAGDHGVVTEPVTFKTAGTQTVTATDTTTGSITGTSGTVAVTHAGATKVVVTAQPPATVTAGIPFGLTATVEDAYGNTVTTSSATVTVALTTNPGSATLLGTTTVTATEGVATFSGFTLDKAGTGYTLKVTSGSLTPTVTTTVTVTPAAATHFVLQAPGTATAGTAVNVTVTATDAYGNTATGYIGTVHFTSTDPQAALPGDVTFTAGDHGAVTEPVTFKTAGTQTVTATDTTTGSITGTSGTVAVTHAGAAKVVVTAQPPTTVTAGTPFGITAKIKDAYGNTVTTSSATVTVALTTNPGSATLLGTTTVTATEGVATFGNLTLDKAGTGYTLAVTSGSLASDTTRTFTVTHATAAKVVVTTQPPATVTAGTPFGITAKIEDAFGNVVTTSSATVTVAITSGPDGATLLGTTTVTATAGVATFSGLTLDKAGTGYTLKVTSGSLTPAVTTTVTVTPAAATHFVLQTVSTATAGTAVNVTVTATDAYGNTATGYIGTVHFTSTDPQAALPGDVTFTAGDHGAVTEPVTFKTAGTQTVTATDTTTGSITGTSGTVAVTHAGAAKVVVTAQPPTTVTAGTPFGITAKIKDAYGNTVTTSSATVTVALTANPGSATLLGTTTVTATAGVATFGGLAPDQAGSYVLAVTASGLVGATTSPVVVVAVPAGAPLDVTAVVPSDPGLANGAVVSWGPPTTTGGSPVTSYSVVPTDVTAGSGGPATTVGAAARSATVLGLVAGDLYSFTVTATTSAGPGAPSAASNQVVPVSQLPSAANGATSTSPSGTATASLGTPGTVGSLTATATGTGTVTVARYPTAPIGALTAGGAYYDVSISPGNGFTSVVFTVCGVKIGTSVEWWNPTAQQNQPVSDQTAPQGLAGCVTVTITATTTPNLSQLVGTVFTVPSAEAPPGPGYTLWGADGGVYTFGGATDYGSTRGQIVGVATTPDGRGYWQVGSDGGVFAFGDAPFYGSMGGQVLSAPIVGFAPTPDGNGYWLVAADGGVFAFGDAPFYGSMGGRYLAAPVVQMAPTPDGNGYWLVAADGGVFAFGDAQFDGSRAGSTNAGPIVGIAPTADGSGYWLVAADGGVFAYGDAPFYGSMGGAPLAAPVVGMTVTTGAGGYWLVAADGGVFAFGDAQFYGSMAGHQLAAPVLSLSPGG